MGAPHAAQSAGHTPASRIPAQVFWIYRLSDTPPLAGRADGALVRGVVCRHGHGAVQERGGGGGGGRFHGSGSFQRMLHIFPFEPACLGAVARIEPRQERAGHVGIFDVFKPGEQRLPIRDPQERKTLSLAFNELHRLQAIEPGHWFPSSLTNSSAGFLGISSTISPCPARTARARPYRRGGPPPGHRHSRAPRRPARSGAPE